MEGKREGRKEKEGEEGGGMEEGGRVYCLGKLKILATALIS